MPGSVSRWRGRAGARGPHLVQPGAQVDTERAEQVGLVLDDEDALRLPRTRRARPLGPRPGISRPGRRGELSHARPQPPDLADNWSSAMFSSSTLTVGSPRKPSCRPWVYVATSASTSPTGSCSAPATRLTCVAPS